jgi:STAS-like domain of unknown function (DUF4325)
MVIRIRDFVSGANTSEEGEIVFDRFSSELTKKSAGVIVSFEGIQTATSSFVNAAFVELLNKFSYAELKSRVRVTNSTRQINDMIRTRLERSSAMVA